LGNHHPFATLGHPATENEHVSQNNKLIVITKVHNIAVRSIVVADCIVILIINHIMSTSTPSTATTFLGLAGSKLRSQLSSQMVESASSGPGAFAKQQLEKMGWTEGTGLGKNRDGISTHIRVQKRADETGGIGKTMLNDDTLQIGNTWWKTSVGDTLAKLAASRNNTKKKKKKDSKKKSKHTYTDEELFEATGGARFGMRAQGKQKGKFKRTESDISKTEEQEAKEKVEWDGMAAPKVYLSSSSSKQQPTPEETSSDENPKKKRKLEKSDDDNVDDKEEAKKKKKQKKESKKSSGSSSESEKKAKKKKKKSKKRKEEE
jgi:Pin2-interacting protein X1